MHSMTGFGRGSATAGKLTANVEISCVNRKQAEVVVQVGRDLNSLEARIRKATLEHFSRGRIQVAIQLDQDSDQATAIEVDEGLAKALEAAFEQISTQLGRSIQAQAADFLRTPGILNLGESGIDPEDAWSAIEPALAEAIEQALAMRASEGQDLAEDMSNRLATLEQQRITLGELAPARPERYREALLKRLRDGGLDLDLNDERVLREIGLFADRCDVSEELTRLDSHFRKFREYLASTEPVGRSLDFLCQELHREFNTIGSKASDADIAQNVVIAKTELEKIREQVQNAE